MSKEPKTYGAYILHFIDDGNAVGVFPRIHIEKDTPPEIKKAIEVIAAQINTHFEVIVTPISNKKPN